MIWTQAITFIIYFHTAFFNRLLCHRQLCHLHIDAVIINWHKWINGRIDELWWVDKMCMYYVWCVIVIRPETCLNYTYVFDGCRQIILWLCKEFGLRSSSWSVNDDECGLWENYKWINVRFISPLLMDVCLIVEWENCVLCFNV